MVMHQTDSRDTAFGTVKIGSKESNTQVKIYTKSHELKTWKQEKSYINELHRKYFKNADVICRVEAIANSKAFNRRELDLLDLLLPEKHPRIFQSLIGDKLKFKNLNDYQWDSNNNKKFIVFDLIDSIYYATGQVESVTIKQNVTTHNNQYNKFKIIVHEYLDGEIGIMGIISFMRCNIWKNKTSITKYEYALHRIITKQDTLNAITKRKVDTVQKLLDTDGKGLLVTFIIAKDFIDNMTYDWL